jgi:tripartite-type tricarboxylate transporter receptor subunit TctC
MMNKVCSLLVAAVLALPVSAHAWQPSADVNVIVAYKAGSGTDTGARLLAAEAEKYVGKTLIINNLPGGDGKIGWTELVKAKADGHTIGFINLPTFTTLATAKDSTFKTADIIPICNHLTETGVVVVKADSKWKTLKDLVDDCKANPNKNRCSTNGVQASNHTAAQLLATSADFKYKAIPYGGTADQLLALRQGEVQFSCAKVADVAKLIKGDKPELRVLGVFATERVKELPDVPTLGELGYYKEWYGSARALVAPAGTPKEVIDFYVDAFRKTMEDPATVEAHKKAGLAMDFMDNEKLGALIGAQEKFCSEVVANLYK